MVYILIPLCIAFLMLPFLFTEILTAFSCFLSAFLLSLHPCMCRGTTLTRTGMSGAHPAPKVSEAMSELHGCANLRDAF